MSLSTSDTIRSKRTMSPPGVLSGRIVDWNDSNEQLVITVGDDCPSLEYLFDELNTLRNLPHNWDSYGAEVVSYEAAINTLLLFCQVMYDETPYPQVIPTNSGNIQLEWHIYGIDLEVEISKEGSVHCFYEDTKDKQEVEWTEDFNYAVALLTPFIKTLTERELSSKAAA